tara:strand:+ start:476 stop:664 length:189 start_codon:yes stop_codon:yes gene_type:complete
MALGGGKEDIKKREQVLLTLSLNVISLACHMRAISEGHSEYRLYHCVWMTEIRESWKRVAER